MMHDNSSFHVTCVSGSEIISMDIINSLPAGN